MMEFNRKEFKSQFVELIKKSNISVQRLVDCAMYSVRHEYDEDEDMHTSILKNNIKILSLQLLTYMEHFGLNDLRRQFIEDMLAFNKNQSEIEYNHHLDYGWSPCLELIENYFIAITSDIQEGKDNINRMNDIEILERILIGTGKYISDRNILPESEAEVRKSIYDMLIHVFPDTVREIPISKVTKVYKPDFGVKSLGVAIEYKYIASDSEAKKIIGGIYEDIHGYAGSEDWKIFYAVLYMTDHYFTPAQIQAEFDMSDVDQHKWKPIVVLGRGIRKKKKQDG